MPEHTPLGYQSKKQHWLITEAWKKCQARIEKAGTELEARQATAAAIHALHMFGDVAAPDVKEALIKQIIEQTIQSDQAWFEGLFSRPEIPLSDEFVQMHMGNAVPTMDRTYAQDLNALMVPATPETPVTNEVICTMITNPQNYLLPLTEQNVHDQPEICSQQRWLAKIVALLMHRTEHQQMHMKAFAEAFTHYADQANERHRDLVADLKEQDRLYQDLKSEQKDLAAKLKVLAETLGARVQGMLDKTLALQVEASATNTSCTTLIREHGQSVTHNHLRVNEILLRLSALETNATALERALEELKDHFRTFIAGAITAAEPRRKAQRGGRAGTAARLTRAALSDEQ